MTPHPVMITTPLQMMRTQKHDYDQNPPPSYKDDFIADSDETEEEYFAQIRSSDRFEQEVNETLTSSDTHISKESNN